MTKSTPTNIDTEIEEILDLFNSSIRVCREHNASMGEPYAIATQAIQDLITSARIEELEKLLKPRDCLRPDCKTTHSFLNKLHINQRINQLTKYKESK